MNAGNYTTDGNAPSTLTLTTPVEFVPGIGGQRASLLAKLGVRTVADLIFLFPRDYEDHSDRRRILDLEEDKVQTVCGKIVEVDGRSTGFGRSRVGILLNDGSDNLRATWFNQPFMRDKFHAGQLVMLSGKPREKGGRWEMAHPRVRWLDDPSDGDDRKLLPLYPLTEGIKQYQLRRMVADLLDVVGASIPEVLPESLRQRCGLLPIREALAGIHLPANHEALAVARRRFVFQELLVLQLALAARRFQQRTGFKAPALPTTAQIDARIRRLIPFELTAGQSAAIEKIVADISRETPMNRLLQGDVGSGKTLVAIYAILVCVAAGHQAAVLTPTEILARQHYQTLDRLLQKSRVRFKLLTGGLSGGERQTALAEISAGNVDVVIGTHALLQEDVQFDRLGLAVIDEQHKFGVRQRAMLRSGNQSPHYLVMTATPIPRTVSMTLFGDLDVSTVRDKPPGRQAIKTYVVDSGGQSEWWSFVRRKLRLGRQAYVVAPLVEESAHITAGSVDEAFETLTNSELAEFRVGILHGRMSSSEKEDAMDRFRRGETQVLVSTTVIEVGVDVPNATVMVIDSAERFGLSQLHQLRGRIGRGSHPGFCAVLVGEELSTEARERLDAFASTSDGFELAELDFRLRGPGDLFGTKQHGLPPLRVADLRRDRDTIEEARTVATQLFADDPGLSRPEHALLRRQMLTRYGQALDLADVG